MTAVELDSVGMVFNRNADNEVTALDRISVSIGSGEFLSLIGPSGCGKSTMLRLIGDLLAPTSGSITVNGKTPHQARLDRDYAMVFQSSTLLEWRSVLDNVALPLEIMDVPKAEREAKAREMLELVQLGAFADHHPYELSGGMQQRVSIARALSFGPSILLMDEPFGALDEMTRERMQLEVLDIWRETGTTVVFVTHSIPEAVFLSTRVVVLSPRPGRISDVIDIDLPQPRNFDTREDPRFYEHLTTLRESLRKVDVE